jgi:hypothetical protein
MWKKPGMFRIFFGYISILFRGSWGHMLMMLMMLTCCISLYDSCNVLRVRLTNLQAPKRGGRAPVPAKKKTVCIALSRVLARDVCGAMVGMRVLTVLGLAGCRIKW